MNEKLKSLSNYLLGGLFFVAILTLPVVFIMGSLWVSVHLLPVLTKTAWIVFAIDLLIFLPLSILRSCRGFTGTTIYLSSYLFGIVTWFYGLILTYSLWGILAVVIGLMIVGIGVVPIAMLATLLKGMWGHFSSLILLVFITFGSRWAGMAIAESNT